MSNSTKEKAVRVFELAKELNLESKVLLDYCKDLGYADVKNQLKGLSADQVDALKDRAKRGPAKAGGNGTPAPMPSGPVVLPPTSKSDNSIRSIPKAKTAAPIRPVVDVAPHGPAVVEEPPVAEVAPEPEPVYEPEPEPTPEPVAEAPASPPPPPAKPQNVIPNINLGGNRPLNLNRPSAARPAPKPAAPAPTPPAAELTPEPVAEVPPPVSPPPAPVEPPKQPAAEAPPAPPVVAPKPVLPTTPPRPMSPPNLTAQRPGMPNLGARPNQPPLQRPGATPNNPQRPAAPAPGAPRPGQPVQQRPGTPPPAGQRPGGNPPPQFGPPKPPAAASPFGPPKPPPPGMKPPIVPPSRMAPGQMKLTPEMIAKIREAQQKGKRLDLKDIHKTGEVPGTQAPGGPPNRGPGFPPRPGTARPGFPSPAGPADGSPASDDDRKRGAPGGGSKTSPGEVSGRDARHKARQDKGRRTAPSTNRNSVIIGPGGRVDMIETGRTWARGRKKQQVKPSTTIKTDGPVSIAPPITVRSLSEAIGMKTGELGKRLLKETNKLYGNNSPVEFEVAELIAIEKGITLVLKKQDTAEDILLKKYREQAEAMDPASAVPRPPIVTIMGHVDHGKTSLLDKIRQEFGVKSDVVSTEAGGITQVIRAWQVEKEGKKTTFLDTPGHEAFTKMRARGAKVTDIVVIVVAATDGVMPQTEEAIAHAKAADVHIVVAINKVDMPNANIEKTRRQLYSLELLPDDMGGEVPFVETSAVTGQGIEELLEQIAIVAELSDPPLVADPGHPGSGTCLEAYLEGQEGVMATLIVQQGTLRKGDVLLCGATYGRVRAMYDDHGRPIEEAGPSTPVKITGLDDVPDADDPFFAVDDVATAREIAEKRKVALRTASLSSFAPVSLESLTAQRSKIKITELKVILKAEARGSVEAIKKELEKLVHEEVRARVLHAGIGAITESDVTLALTSPDDTLVVGFNVTADDAALKLAENRGISIREYDIIYKLTEDVKAALEGKLKPVEEVVHLGRAVIRETFKITKVGTIAGCYVTSGVIERSARVRVIRQGVVIFPPSEKVVGLDSLKRFKEDAKEVREGFECGMKISGFDDVKVDDVIEAFKIEVKTRTL